MTQLTRDQQIAALEKDWAENPRWKGIKRSYSAADVVRLRGSVQVEHTLAKRGAEKLWNLVNTEPSQQTPATANGCSGEALAAPRKPVCERYGKAVKGDLWNVVSALAVLRRAEGANDMPGPRSQGRARALRGAKRGFGSRQFRR